MPYHIKELLKTVQGRFYGTVQEPGKHEATERGYLSPEFPGASVVAGIAAEKGPVTLFKLSRRSALRYSFTMTPQQVVAH